LIFKNAYEFLSSIIFYISVKTKLNNEIIFVSLNLVILILAILLSLFIFKQSLKNKIPDLRKIGILIGISILFFGLRVGLNFLSSDIMVKINLENSRVAFLTNYGYKNMLDEIFPLFFLAILLYRIIRSDLIDSTVGNNV
jgi:hypothetical protein